jgi:hypothetical protein
MPQRCCAGICCVPFAFYSRGRVSFIMYWLAKCDLSAKRGVRAAACRRNKWIFIEYSSGRQSNNHSEEWSIKFQIIRCQPKHSQKRPVLNHWQFAQAVLVCYIAKNWHECLRRGKLLCTAPALVVIRIRQIMGVRSRFASEWYFRGKTLQSNNQRETTHWLCEIKNKWDCPDIDYRDGAHKMHQEQPETPCISQ